MIQWEAVAALSTTAAVIGGLFLWVVTMIVSKAIRDAVNGFAIKLALQQQTIDAFDKRLEVIDKYTHNEMHERMNSFSKVQLEAFNAGRAIGPK